MMLQTTVHHNASAREDPIEHTFAHSCTLEHSDDTVFYDVTLVQFYIASLLYYFINKYRIAIVSLLDGITLLLFVMNFVYCKDGSGSGVVDLIRR